MSYAKRNQLSSNRTVPIVMSALITFLMGYALVSGLAYSVVKQAAEDLKTFDVEDEPPPPPDEPPPPPEENPLPPPPPEVSAPPPLVRIESPAPQIQTTQQIQPPAPPTPVYRPAPPAPPAPPPPPRKVQTARAKANLNSYFSTDDYPQAALRNEEQGTTAVSLSIGTDGRVTNCTVTSSSGSRSLDDTTCRILRNRARFTPARDDTGNPTTDTTSTRIVWVVPAE
jgi:protein TonB